jgi:hypothetical protein
MRNKILTLVSVIVIIGAIFFGVNYKNKSNTESTLASVEVKDSAWAVFEKYLGFVKAHDIDGLKTVTYQLGGTCSDPTKTKECYQIMDDVYEKVKIFNKEDFINVDFDSKQIVLATDHWTSQSDNTRSLLRQIIYFYRDPVSGPKVIAYTVPFEVTFVTIDFSLKTATSTIDTRLKERVQDSDRDYLPDEIESCSTEGASPDCPKTNPNKRDSKRDGWWDGVRIFIKS